MDSQSWMATCWKAETGGRRTSLLGGGGGRGGSSRLKLCRRRAWGLADAMLRSASRPPSSSVVGPSWPTSASPLMRHTIWLLEGARGRLRGIPDSSATPDCCRAWGAQCSEHTPHPPRHMPLGRAILSLHRAASFRWGCQARTGHRLRGWVAKAGMPRSAEKPLDARSETGSWLWSADALTAAGSPADAMSKAAGAVKSGLPKQLCRLMALHRSFDCEPPGSFVGQWECTSL